MTADFDGTDRKVETETAGSSFVVVSFVLVVVIGIVAGVGIVVVKVGWSTVAAVLVRSIGVVRN